VNEVHLMGQQQHPAVLPLYAAFLVDDQLWMVLPYVAGGSAEDVLKRQGTPVRVQGLGSGQGQDDIQHGPGQGRVGLQKTSSIGRALWCVCRTVDPRVHTACCAYMTTPLVDGVKRLFIKPYTIAFRIVRVGLHSCQAELPPALSVGPHGTRHRRHHAGRGQRPGVPAQGRHHPPGHQGAALVSGSHHLHIA